MPYGRKSRQKIKGGGFGKSLQSGGKRETAGFDYQKPDPTRCRLNGEEDKDVSVLDFISSEKAKVSCIQAKDLDDYFTQTLAQHKTYGDQRNLVLVGKDAQVSKVGPARLMTDQTPQTTTGLFSKSSNLFTIKKSVSAIPLPQRPFVFRDPANRVLDFAAFFGRRLLAETDKRLSDQSLLSIPVEDALAAIGDCSDPRLLQESLRLYFQRRENFAPFMSAKDLEAEELAAFARWRQQISKIEAENREIVITPYEKNPEYWKQLWRTVERSDFVLEIVDARNPLLFRSPAFESMVRRSGKPIVLLMNKTDFLSNQQRKKWRAYFEENQIQVIFYSAIRELSRQQTEQTLRLSKDLLASLAGVQKSPPPQTSTQSDVQQVKEVTRKLDAFAALLEGEESSSATRKASSVTESADEAESSESLTTSGSPTTPPPPTYLSLLAMDDEDCLDCDQLLEELEARGKELVGKKTIRYTLASAIYDHLEKLVDQYTEEEKINLYTDLAKHTLDIIYPLSTKQVPTTEEDDDEDDEDDDDSDDEDDDDSDDDDDVSEENDNSENDSDSTKIQREPLEHVIVIDKDLRKKLVSSFLSVFIGPKQSLQIGHVDGEEGLPETAVESFLRPVIGTCGFPNVGKSSLINTLLKGTKRVAVSRTPGKTRHLQTIRVPNSILTLCDCPGLIFPTIASAKEDLVLNNAASVDIFRGSLVSVVALMLRRVASQVGEVFGVQKHFDRIVELQRQTIDKHAREAISAIAVQRRYIAGGKGEVPDVERACRVLIKAYCQGQTLSYCECSPNSNPRWWQSQEDEKWTKKKQILHSQ